MLKFSTKSSLAGTVLLSLFSLILPISLLLFMAPTAQTLAAKPIPLTPPTDNSAPKLKTSSLKNGKVNKAYSQQVTASDFDLADTLTMEATDLPPGFTLGSCQTTKVTKGKDRLKITCTISGTTTQSGTYSPTVTVQDNHGASDSNTYSLRIR